MPGKIMELPTISQALAGAPPPPPQLTNTLVVTQLPPEFFAHVEILDALRDHFGAFGPLHSWAPLKAFHRAILVYYAAEDAERVKLHCDGLSLDLYPGGDPVILRVFRADPSPTTAPPMSGPDGPYLCPPDTGKNFLISPPGSPPIGWEQVVEDPPNATPLAEDLISALKKLQLLDRTKPSGVVGPEILLESEETGGISVYVEDCDGGEDGRGEDGGREEQWVYGVTMASQMRFKPTATSRPPAMEEGMVA